MDQDSDARGNGTVGEVVDEIDARGNETSDSDPGSDTGTDARGNGGGAGAPGCAECGGALRASGPGRRPVYCGRACSSRAYRRRRVEGQRDAVADALVASRVEIPAGLDGGAAELLELAAAVQRSAARYLEHLETARRGEGDDPRCDQALRSLEAGVTGAGRRLLDKAHLLRHEMLVVSREAGRHVADVPGADPGDVPGADPDDVLAESTRVGTGHVASPDVGPVESTRVGTGLAVDPGAARRESPRVETGAAGALPRQAAPAPGEGAAAPQERRLALAAERTSTPPFLRRLGVPTETWSAREGAFLIEGWPGRTVFAVRRPGRRLAGWVEATGSDSWASFADGRAVIDPADGLPWLSQDETYAVSLLLEALDQQLA